MQVEELDFILLPTRDLERARAFYSETLGLPIDTDSPRWVEVLAGGVTLALWDPESMGMPFAPTPNPVALRVPDVAAARAELAAAGVKFDGDIIDSGVCHMANFADPDGNRLMLHRRYAPRRK
jgi:catechol 2,3-dioxygenase-like lactoylglutathione lyase family enzyme